MRNFLALALIFLSFSLSAQDNVGIGTLTPNPNAALDIESNDKGLLIPRLDAAQRAAIVGLTNIESGLLVFDQTDNLFYFWDGNAWLPMPIDLDEQDIDSVVLTGRILEVFISNGNSATVDLTPLAAVGPAGPPGADGADGIDGADGAPGPAGPPGADGADGVDGAPGPVGPPGADGADGADGAPGPAGPPGADGADGIDGADGAPGPAGPPGADGADGIDGADGADGAPGPAGPPGADGADGAPGPVGPPGPAGSDDQNLTSATLTGNILEINIENGSSVNVDLSSLSSSGGTDDQNIQGSGLAGNILTIGIEGGTSETIDLSSLAGIDGADGADGAPGPAGPPGADGADGADGVDGAPGPAGPPGADGADGADGVDGAPGPAGPPGADGAPGPAGPAGPQGPAGPGGTDDQNIQGSGLAGTTLTIGIEGGTSETIDLSSLVSDDWALLGNSGTDENTNYLGTNDNQDLVFRTNGQENMRINTNGNVGIGTTSDQYRLYVSVPSTDLTTRRAIYSLQDGGDATTTTSRYNIYAENSSLTSGVKYGIRNNVNNFGTGSRYGLYNTTLMNPGSTGTGYGIYNYLLAWGDGLHRGSYNSLSLNGPNIGNQNFANYNNVGISSSSVIGKVYGEYNDIDFGADTSYGEYNEMNTSASSSTTVYGQYNSIEGTGSQTKYGTYNSLEATGSGIQYAVYNNLQEGTGTKYGVRNEFADIDGSKYGVYNRFDFGTSSGAIYGTSNVILNDGPSVKRGTYNLVQGGEGSLAGSYNQVTPAATNSSNIYGVYANVSADGTGTHYGGYFSASGGGNRAVYGLNAAANGYAGYFVGNGYWDGDMVYNESGILDHNFRVESDTREYALFVDAEDDLVRFGTNFTGINGQTNDNGDSVNNILVDYVVDMDIGAATGTAIGIGSIEYLLDASSLTTINNNFAPSTDNVRDLGSSALRWDDVYATNGVIQTSDRTEKESIQSLSYGLNDLLKLNPVSFKWNKTHIGITPVSSAEKEVKLGFIAQEVMEVLPEIVQTHNWMPISEDRPGEFALEPMALLGMSYHEFTPVIVKAIQEQQEIIESLKTELKEVKALLEQNGIK